MGCATIDFTDVGGFVVKNPVKVNGLADEQLHLEPEISPE